MKGSGVGGDSWLYRIFLIGGFLCIILSTVTAALTQPDNSRLPMYVGIGSVAVFMIAIVGYWVVQIVFKGYGSMQAADPSQKMNVNDLAVLQSWNTLFNAMVIAGGDPSSMKQAAKRGNRSLVIWFIWGAVVALCPIGFMVPYLLGLLPWSYTRYLVALYLGIVVLMLFVSLWVLNTSTKAGQEVVLGPLGLQLSALPIVALSTMGPQVRGATVMDGTRFGRGVRVEMDAGGSSSSVTYRAPDFELKSRSGALEADGSQPAAVQTALQPLRKAKRWEGITITGGANGISIRRRGSGQNLWLYDLWLIERIIAQFEGKQGA